MRVLSTLRPVRCRAAALMPIAASLLLSVSVIRAQTVPFCPPQALLAITRAGSACASIEPGTACFGGGEGGFALSGEPALTPAQPGDRISLRQIDAAAVLDAGSADDAPVSMAALVIRTSPAATDLVTVLLFEDARLTADNSATAMLELPGTAVGALPVRAAPDIDAELVAQLGVNAGILVNGRADGGEWLRVIVPETGALGWVSAALVNAPGIGGLPIVAPGEAVTQPFQSLVFESDSGALACGGALPAGALLQTPSTDLDDAVALTLNGAALRLAGTLFLREADGALRLIVLDGVAQLGSDPMAGVIPAGAALTVEGDAGGALTGDLARAVPYDDALTVALPVNNLPRRFTVSAPLGQADIDIAIAALNAPPALPVIALPTAVDACRRSITRDATVWAGPGEDFEVLTELDAGTPITPVLATTDPFGAAWWQLQNSGWVALSDIVERGNCTGQPVPVTARVPPPATNVYSLERCESFNGAVRAGQQVTVEFIPPAWDSYAAARVAVQTDPGRFSFNSSRVRAAVSEPILLGTNQSPLESRYVRRFTTVWTAQAGTYRITGDWLTYEPSCNLTVPVE